MSDKPKEKVVVTGEKVDAPDLKATQSAPNAPDRPYGVRADSPIGEGVPVAPSYADATADDPARPAEGKKLGVEVGMTVHYVMPQAESVNPLPLIPTGPVPPGAQLRGIDRAAIVTHVLDPIGGAVSLTILTRGPEDGQNSGSGSVMRPSVGYDGKVASLDTWHFIEDDPKPLIDPDLDEAHQEIARLERELAAAKAKIK